jgi:glycosyltransferase involved in cell wall biosynthesis
MPSRREPYGLVALETMATGRPLLVSTADGLKDHATLGAVAVDTLSVEAWSDALRQLCKAPDHARAGAAKQRVAQAEQRFAEGWAKLLHDAGLH